MVVAEFKSSSLDSKDYALQIQRAGECARETMPGDVLEE